jgi:hypothetical protein
MAQLRSAKSKFESHEDSLLSEAVRIFGTRDWWLVASAVPNRTARQCRERWCNYLNPRLISRPWTEPEDRLLLEKADEMGCRWNVIVSFFDGRSKNSLRNRYRSIKRHTGRARVSEVPRCEGSRSAKTETPEPVIDDPFAFLDRIDDEWNSGWCTDFGFFFP